MQEFVSATSAHPNVLHVVESLLGGPVRTPNRNRGIYFIFPRCATSLLHSLAKQSFCMRSPTVSKLLTITVGGSCTCRSVHEKNNLPIQVRHQILIPQICSVVNQSTYALLEQAQLGPHIDPFTAQLSAAIYLDDVGIHAGEPVCASSLTSTQ